MQISTILVNLSTKYEHVVVIIVSHQPYNLTTVTSVLLDVEAQQHDNVMQIGTNLVASTVRSSTSNNSGGS